MSEVTQFVVFRLGEQRCALPLSVVERLVRAVEVTSLPDAPSIVIGAINVAGRVLPVISLRRKFGLAEREIDPADQFLIARAGGFDVVLAIDDAEGVVVVPAAEIVGAAGIAPGLEQIRGVIRRADGLVLIHDLEALLSLEEARALDDALRREASHANE